MINPPGSTFQVNRSYRIYPQKELQTVSLNQKNKGAAIEKPLFVVQMKCRGLLRVVLVDLADQGAVLVYLTDHGGCPIGPN